MNTSIKHIKLTNLFNEDSIEWELHEDVNILVGINGIGKTTIIRSINALLSQNYSFLHDKNARRNIAIYVTLKNGIEIFYDNNNKKESEKPINHTLITTFDVPLRDKGKMRQLETPLDKELRDLWYTLGTNQPSFFNYRLKATNFPEEASKINRRIDKFFKSIDILFSETEKQIGINYENNEIIFKKDKSIIPLSRLSSGEKQMLLILLTVFLMEEKPYILLMDEPEISLHISWQQQLIDTIRSLNPNCQIIMATHSPSIFGEGWGDKMFFVEDLFD